MQNNEAPSLVPKERGRLYGLISAWLIPQVPPPLWRRAVAAAIGVVMAMMMRITLLGVHGGVGATQPFFPAVMLVTLYAGWRWGLVPLLGGALFGWWLWGGRDGLPLDEDELSTLVIYLVCGIMVTAVAEGLRGAMRGLALAREGRAEAEARLRVTQTAAGVGPWDYDLETGELYLSPAARKNMAIPVDAEIGLDDLPRYVHPDDREDEEE